MAISRRNATEEPTINLTPMIDVVFLLIIFFMVGTKFSDSESRIDVNLPRVDQNQSLVRGPDRRVVSINQFGETSLDDQPMALDQIRQTLALQAASFPELKVVVGGDAQVSHQQFVEVMQTIRAAGINQIGISTRGLR